MGKRKSKWYKAQQQAEKVKQPTPGADPDTAPDWNHNCEVCGQTPVVPLTGMCGPCTYGEADTAGGNW
jgi:CO dehydrogenase/acetyl-CoA synthase alpha subunit